MRETLIDVCYRTGEVRDALIVICVIGQVK